MLRDYTQTLPTHCTNCGNKLKKASTHEFVEAPYHKHLMNYCIPCAYRNNIQGKYYHNGMLRDLSKRKLEQQEESTAWDNWMKSLGPGYKL